MIWGRPVNLWLGLVASAAGAVTISLIAAGVDPTLVANLVGAAVGVLGAAIALVAYQPPTLAPGDTYTIQTPAGQPNYEQTVAKPPAASPPPEPVADGKVDDAVAPADLPGGGG